MDVGASCVTWTYNPKRGGRQKVENTTGCLMVEHDPTGKFILLVCEKISQEARIQLQALTKMQHPNKAMSKLYLMDPSMRFLEFPTNGIREARRLEKLIREKVEPKYLLLN